MIESWLEMWNGKKWLFFLLLIPMIVILVLKLLTGSNISGAQEDVNEAQDKDNELADKQNEYNDKANSAKQDADNHQDNIDNIDNSDDENWRDKL
jgi:Tfp pilus assembly protein PilO